MRELFLSIISSSCKIVQYQITVENCFIENFYILTYVYLFSLNCTLQAIFDLLLDYSYHIARNIKSINNLQL